VLGGSNFIVVVGIAMGQFLGLVAGLVVSSGVVFCVVGWGWG